MEIFKLWGSIFVDSDEANKSIAKTESQASKLTSTIGETIKTAGKIGTAIVAGATAAVGGLVAIANKTAETTDRIDKMSQKIGISRESFQEWDFILSQNGASVDGLQMGLKTLSKAADEAGRGVSTYTRIFDRLGISVRDTNGEIKGQEQLFNETILALSRMENETERTSLATQLLGRSAQELAPMLNSGAESVEALRAKAHELGLVLGDDAVDAGVQFTDTMDQLKRSFGAVATVLGASILPLAQEFAGFIIDNMPMIQSVLGSVFDVLESSVASVLPFLMDLTQSVMPPLVALLTSLAENVLPPVIAVATEIFQTVLPPIIDLVSQIATEILPPLIALFMELSEGVLPVLMEVFKALVPVIEPVMTTIAAAITAALALIRGDWDEAATWILEAWNGLWDTVKAVLTAVVDVLDAIFGGLPSKLIDAAKEMAVGVAEWFTALRDRNIERVQTLINKITSLFNLAHIVQEVKDAAVGAAEWFTALKDRNIERMQGLWDGIVSAFSPSRLLEAITGAFQGTLTYLKDVVPKAFIDGGINIINSFLGGLMDAARKVPLVGDKIAGFLGQYLIGKSPPPLGPLSRIDKGGQNVIRAWLDGMLSTLPEIAGVGEVMAEHISTAIKDSSGLYQAGADAVADFAVVIAETLRGASDSIADFFGSTARDFWNGTATWATVLQGFAGAIGGIFGNVFDTIAKELASNLIAQNTWLVSTLANIATTVTAYLGQAYAALTGFFWFLGPGAPLAAAGVIGAAIAGIAAIGGSMIRGILPDAPSPGGGPDPGTGGGGGSSGGSSGGRQVSEITGPTRDLLRDVAAGLAPLGTLTGIGERIYNLLDTRLPEPGMAMAGAGGTQVVLQPGAIQVVAQETAGATIDQIKRELADALAFDLRGQGR